MKRLVDEPLRGARIKRLQEQRDPLHPVYDRDEWERLTAEIDRQLIDWGEAAGVRWATRG